MKMRAYAVLFSCAPLLGLMSTSANAASSADLFAKMSTVLQHPRCMNCHTNEAFPHQGDDQHRHTFNVMRGPDDHGAPGLHCDACHQAINQTASGVPGAPDWHLAPLRMAWQGLSMGELCRALKDPARGAMKPQQFVPHFHTVFVNWAWAPGTDPHGRARATPPLSQAEFIATTKAWIASGSACPE